MIGIEERTVCDGVSFRSIRDTKFKTMRISAHLIVPMRRQNAAENALLPFLLSRASREYPDFTKLSQRLAELYGASLNADVQKIGDLQVLTISASGIADRYALNGEAISGELAALLCSILFDPPLVDGLFPEDGVKQEKRQTMELIDSEYSDKRAYARQRCEEIMCADEPFGINRYGSKEEIAHVERPALTKAWERLLHDAKVELMVLGDCNPEPIYEGFCQAFQKLARGKISTCTSMVVRTAGELKEVTEQMDVAQSKLVMGFRTGTSVLDEAAPAARLMIALFGGTPNSKLFLNVREKLSLCYYCSASYNGIKGIMLVQSGVETKNIERAKEEILRQLEEVKQGNFDSDEVEAAKMSLCNSYRTISDSLGGLDSWYLSQSFANHSQQPDEAAAEINAVTRQEIIDAANRVTLDTVYCMVGSGEEDAQ